MCYYLRWYRFSLNVHIFQERENKIRSFIILRYPIVTQTKITRRNALRTQLNAHAKSDARHSSGGPVRVPSRAILHAAANQLITREHIRARSHAQPQNRILDWCTHICNNFITFTARFVHTITIKCTTPLPAFWDCSFHRRMRVEWSPLDSTTHSRGTVAESSALNCVTD